MYFFISIGNPKNNNLEIWQLNENGTTRISNAPFETGNTLQELESRYFRISKIFEALRYDFGEIKN